MVPLILSFEQKNVNLRKHDEVIVGAILTVKVP